MMDIQKQREAFEKHASKFFTDQKEAFKTQGDRYLYDEVVWMWDCWINAKTQAVPEGFVLVLKLSANYLFNKVPELSFKHQDEKDTVLYHLNYMASEFKGSAKDFIDTDHAKQQAMIEAQEQGHE